MGAGLTEERFRDLLDEHGILRPCSLAPPERSSSFLVFSQHPDARLDIGQLRQQATRFFATRIGLSVEKRYPDAPPATDAARVVVARDDGLASGTRLCFGRPVEPGDLAMAEEAERRQNGTGMSLLAGRCPTAWLIETEGGDEDRAALTLAAVFASVMLGPIVPPSGLEVFGVRTARLKLEQRPDPYR